MRRKPSFTRADRIEHLMLGEVERLLAYEVKDALAQNIKVTTVRLSPDLGHLRVGYVLHDGSQPFEALTDMLARTTPFVARTLREELALRHRLTVAFAFDREADQLERVRALLRRPDPAPEESDGTEPRA
ncbi:MAG: ribosome-binding factor A [Deltaproteobacteria bacterium]|nr:ribosome-binding factor A [Deltaproteobacteria bacterium]